MNLKKIVISALSIVWLVFYVLDFMTKLVAGISFFRKWRPFVIIKRSIQNVKRLFVFALFILNVFLVVKWIDYTNPAKPDKKRSI